MSLVEHCNRSNVLFLLQNSLINILQSMKSYSVLHQQSQSQIGNLIRWFRFRKISVLQHLQVIVGLRSLQFQVFILLIWRFLRMILVLVQKPYRTTNKKEVIYSWHIMKVWVRHLENSSLVSMIKWSKRLRKSYLLIQKIYISIVINQSFKTLNKIEVHNNL